MENNSKNNNPKRGWIFLLMGILCVVVALVLIIVYFMHGKITTTNNGGEIETTESITCTSDQIAYPYFKADESKKKDLKINAVFNNGKLDTITLTYQLDYDDEVQAEQASAEHHAELNKKFYEDSMNADALGTHFSVIKETMQLSLRAESKEITGVTSKYFLIDNTSGNHKKDSLVKIFSNKGLNCTINN
jgi:flagellar basal body-associated protein FliL